MGNFSDPARVAFLQWEFYTDNLCWLYSNTRVCVFKWEKCVERTAYHDRFSHARHTLKLLKRSTSRTQVIVAIWRLNYLKTCIQTNKQIHTNKQTSGAPVQQWFGDITHQHLKIVFDLSSSPLCFRIWLSCHTWALMKSKMTLKALERVSLLNF